MLFKVSKIMGVKCNKITPIVSFWYCEFSLTPAAYWIVLSMFIEA